jgi:hypothetical protein
MIPNVLNLCHAAYMYTSIDDRNSIHSMFDQLQQPLDCSVSFPVLRLNKIVHRSPPAAATAMRSANADRRLPTHGAWAANHNSRLAFDGQFDWSAGRFDCSEDLTRRQFAAHSIRSDGGTGAVFVLSKMNHSSNFDADIPGRRTPERVVPCTRHIGHN